MTEYHKDLCNIAENINNYNALLYTIKVSRRNGYYAIDQFDEKEDLRGCCFCGNYKECWTYLSGMQRAIWMTKPF